MRIGVIRGDIPGPIFVADLEPTSQVNVPTEPAGQTRYISRPTAATVGPFIATLPATLVSQSDISFPLTINGGNQTLRIRGAATDPYTVVNVAGSTYADMSELVAAVNAALLTTPFKAQAFSAVRLTLLTEATGTGTFIAVDSVVNGSTLNAPLGLLVGGDTWLLTSAAGCIASTLPVGGPLDVSALNVRATLGRGLTDTQVGQLADLIAPRFVESNTVLDSFLAGDVYQLLSNSFNPDSTRIPPIANGAAITVVADDGVSLFNYVGPSLTNAQLNVPVPGAITLTGYSLAGPGSPNSELDETKVAIYLTAGTKTLTQQVILAAGGQVSEGSIVIPASIVPPGITSATQTQVQFKSFVTNKLTLV